MNRIECIGGCGRLVLKEQSECRKCRKKRLRAGLKRIKRIEKEKRAEAGLPVIKMENVK